MSLARPPQLHVRNLAPTVTSDALRAHFSKIGTVQDCHIVSTRQSDNSLLSKGYGFVTFENLDQATKAIQTLHRSELDGRTMYVELARRKDSSKNNKDTLAAPKLSFEVQSESFVETSVKPIGSFGPQGASSASTSSPAVRFVPSNSNSTKQSKSSKPNSSIPEEKDPITIPIYKSVSEIVDIGANLTHKSFPRDTLPKLLKQSAKAGVSRIIITGTCLRQSAEAISISSQRDLSFEETGVRLYATAGIHPHDAGRAIEDHAKTGGWRSHLETLITQKGHGHVVAVGECGLDYDRNFSTPADQLVVFEGQLELACQLGLPVFLHNRDAHDDFVRILKKYTTRGLQGVAHCHTDPDSTHLSQLLDLGLYIGITGWVCDPARGADLAKVVPQIPLDRLLIETDAPFLLPKNIVMPSREEFPHVRKPRVNDPALLGWVMKKVAECYGKTEAEIASVTTENARRLFNLKDG